jgi:glucose-1-phosphate adenylyltransferase
VERTLVMLLAGGRGSRLNILGAHRAKPAVPFGGLYRIIDFALSNVMHSKLRYVGVLTQYRPTSLMNHLEDGSPWDLAGHTAKLKILPPYQGRAEFDWYHGTSDAVYQNLNIIRRYKPDKVLILSGDHIYRMNYLEMLETHNRTGAAATLAAMEVPWEDTERFGVIVPDKDGKVVNFQEKVKNADSNLASMGVYIFDAKILVNELVHTHQAGGSDFGKHLIPRMMEQNLPMYIHPFSGYWRDVGTLDSFWQANMDLITPGSGLDISGWNLRTNLGYENLNAMPPSYVAEGAEVISSLVSPGCRIEGKVIRSVLSPGVIVEKGAVVTDSVIMHKTTVQAGAKITRAVIDKHVSIGREAIVGANRKPDGPNLETPTHLSSGITVIGKRASVGNNVTVGCNVIFHPDVAVNMGLVKDGETIKPGP